MKQFLKILAVLFIGSAATVDMVYFNGDYALESSSVNISHSCNGTHVLGHYFFNTTANATADLYQLNLNLTEGHPYIYGPGNTTTVPLGLLNTAGGAGAFNIPFEFPGNLLGPMFNAPPIFNHLFYLNAASNSSVPVPMSQIPTFIPFCPDPCEVLNSNVINLSDCLFENGSFHVNGTYTFNRANDVPYPFDLFFNSAATGYPQYLNNVFVNGTTGTIDFSIPGPLNVSSGDFFLVCNTGFFGKGRLTSDDETLKSSAFPAAIPINNSIATTSLPICPLFELKTDEINLSDPCDCNDPDNVRDASGVITRFHDVLTIDVPAGTVGVIDLSTIISGFRDLGGNLYAAPLIISDITTGPAADSTVTFDFYRDPGEVVNIVGRLTPPMGPSAAVTDDLMAAPCTSAMCARTAAIPTLSEWGIIFLTLLFLIIGVATLRIRSSNYSLQSARKTISR